MIAQPDLKPVDTVAMILAGGAGSRLSVLSARRAKPAVPFGGIYRIIDFTTSNVMRSHLSVVGICTQYKPYSLMDHLSTGEAWGFARRGNVSKILPPYTGEEDSDWYAGTADAIYQNIGFIERYRPDTVLILSGDHIYTMDYRPMIALHRERKAALTIACQEVPIEETDRFGIIVTDGQDRIIGFHEKPKERPLSNLANLGIYVFDASVLYERLRADARNPDSSHDFGHDIIPAMVDSGLPSYVYLFSGYWRDVGTVQSYWEAHMDLLDPKSGLDIRRWQVCTATKNFGLGCLAPAGVRRGGRAEHCIVSWGCGIEGLARHSVLSPLVQIGPDSLVEDSVLLDGVRIGRGCVVRRTIVDKASTIGDGCRIGVAGEEEREEWNDLSVTLVGKQAEIPANYVIYPGCTIPSNANGGSLPPSPLKEPGQLVTG